MSKPFIIEINASDEGCGAVLLQVREDELEHSIVFENKQFSLAERNYDTFECKLLVIKDTLRK